MNDKIKYTLGMMLLNESARVKFAQKMQPETFSDPIHKKIAKSLMQQEFSFEKLFLENDLNILLEAMQIAIDFKKQNIGIKNV